MVRAQSQAQAGGRVNSREHILGRIRACQPAPIAAPTLPAAGPLEAGLGERFAAGVQRMGGRVLIADRPLDRVMRTLHPQAAVICSATPEFIGTRALDGATAPASLADVDVGVVRARFGVAETGSVWLTDADLGVSALAFLSQHLVVLLDPGEIVADMHAAYRRRAEFETDYGVFMTGPSATADIEGVLIHGAQGIRSLDVVLLAR
jgi:L-lactate dehydrogenase complex protein LldG